MFEDKNQLNQPLGTNTQSVNTQEILGQAKAKDIDVHVMPGKFLPQLPKKQVGDKQKISLMVILLVLFLVALIGGGIWFIMNQQNSILSANNSNEVAVNTNTNENVNANENTNTNTNENVNANENTNTNTNENVNANENTNTNINSNTNTSGAEVSALDNDSDGLTHEEEIVFGTGVDDEDTDNDGFSDGQEVANLYNPLVPRQALADSSLVSKYTNVNFDYSLLIPSSWLARELKTDGSQVAILPDSEVGDSILIETNTNTDRLSLEQWKNQLYPQVVFENYTLAGQPALLSQNGVLVLLVTNERVYTIRYRISDTESTYYPTIFEMMIKSFSLEKTPNTIIDGQ
ncbi:hypothetical protein C4566_01090 [Candidatus Parcubacteria bacterium]|nr:MAG: hypothetical protein C4566_01090 [Candidatus Parcubacteria bacterium]